MKRKRNMIILGCALLALCGIILAERLILNHVDKINTIDEIILTTQPKELTSVTWTYDGKTLAFNNTDNVWYSSEDAKFPVNQEKMADFLAHFEEVHASFIIDDVEDYSQYGLKKPLCTITLKSESGEKTVKLGGFSTMDSKRYVSVGDEKVYLIDDDLLEYITTNRDDFMQHDEVPDFEQVKEVNISGDTKLSAVYDPDGVYTYTDDHNYYDVSTGSHRPLKDKLTETYINQLKNLSLTDYATYTASEANLADFGLTNPVRTITVRGTVKSQDDKKKDKEETAEFTLNIGVVETGEVDDDDQPVKEYYARFDQSQIIYKLTDEEYEILTDGSYNSLRPPEVVTLDWESVTGFSFTVEGTTYSATKGELPKEVKEGESSDSSSSSSEEENKNPYILNNQQIDASDIISAVDKLTIHTFNDQASTKTLELSMTINLDNEDYPSLSFRIYRYNGDDCVVVLGGETLGYVTRESMVKLREALLSVVLNLD